MCAKSIQSLVWCTALGAAALACHASPQEFRPPAVPLVIHNPNVSIWSEADKLTDDVTRHWTRHAHPLACLIRIDGTAYRLMGNDPAAVPALSQDGLTVTATRSIYRFSGAGVKVAFTFFTPALPDDLDLYGRPVTYLNWDVASTDGKTHKVQLYQSAGYELPVSDSKVPTTWKESQAGNLSLLQVGATDQTLLRPMGDDTRVNWGYAYLVADKSQAKGTSGLDADLKSAFVSSGSLGATSTPALDGAMAFVFDLGSVGQTAVTRRAMVGYDEIYSIKYFGKPIRPYWRRNGADAASLFQVANRDYAKLLTRSIAFDNELAADATRVGGAEYAQILSLAYRECVAGNGIAADDNKQPLFFTKENTSNGDIATVDVIFPMDPIWVLLSPTLAKASLVSNFMYAGSPMWKFPNAPHDLGTYPQVFGREDGGEGMPVEESGNMIILTDAIAQAEGNANFAKKYWPQLTQWAHYLEQYGLDPENQLCTDDFMGHLAHNANLSVKAILALAAYGDLCERLGDTANAVRYRGLAKADANHWMKVAMEGDHSVLAFDRPNTWSQKYNLVWDRLLGLNVFPAELARKEVAYYKTQFQPYGSPLDSRTKLTKTDWTIWCATMAENKSDFETFISPIYRYLNSTTTRDPIADSYESNNPQSGGMHARPVVGGFFIRMLTDKQIWHKWASRDKFKLGEYAPLPKPPVIQEVIPTALTANVKWHYSTVKPSGGWTSASFDDSNWKEGPAGFGTDGTPGIKVNTRWDSPDIWIRRTFTVPDLPAGDLQLYVYHDEDIEVYVNGIKALSEPSFISAYDMFPITSSVRAQLKPGAKVTIAAHCHQTEGGQGIDVGFAIEKR